MIILIISAYVYSGPFQTWQEKKDSRINFFENLDIDSLGKISINRSGEIIVLEKIGEKWKIAETKDFYVKKTMADNLITSLRDAKKSEFKLVSDNNNKKSEFGTDDKGIIAQLFFSDGKELRFIVGKMGVDYTDTYVSQDGNNETYAVKAGLYSAFSVEDWRDDIIFNSSENDISKIRFQYPNREFTLEKDSAGVWKGILPYEFEAQTEAVGEVLSVMAKLSAIKIPEQNFTGTDLEKGLIIIQATGNNLDNTLMIGGESKNEGEENYFYAKKSDSDNIYLITKKQRDALDKNINDFK